MICGVVVPAAQGEVSKDMLGLARRANVYLLDSHSGEGEFLAKSSFDHAEALARNSAGRFYTRSNRGFEEIDPRTGQSTFLRTPNVGMVYGMAFSPLQVLFAVDNSALWIIDVTTWTGRIVGGMGRSDIRGLAFAADGTLYGWSLEIGLVTIDAATGRPTDVNPDVPGRDIQALAFASSEVLYGASSRATGGDDTIFTIDTKTGEWTRVGSGGHENVQGLEFLDGPIDCKGIKKFKVKCRRGALKARLKSPPLAGRTLIFLRNGGDPFFCTVNDNGKCVVFYGRQSGRQTVSLELCPSKSRVVECGG